MSSVGNYLKGITKFLRKHLTFGRVGFMVYVVLHVCSGAPEASTGRSSGSKNISEEESTV